MEEGGEGWSGIKKSDPKHIDDHLGVLTTPAEVWAPSRHNESVEVL